MTKQFVLLFVLCLAFSQAIAVNVPQNKDTTKTHILDELATKPIILERNYKLSKQQFLSNYGFDFKSIQIIENNFKQRHLSIFYLFIPLIFLLIGFISFIMLLLTALGGMASASLWSAIFFGSIIGYIIGWVLRVLGIINLTKLKKLNILTELIEYRKSVTKNQINKNTNPDYIEVK
jgi:hypothetical protein